MIHCAIPKMTSLLIYVQQITNIIPSIIYSHKNIINNFRLLQQSIFVLKDHNWFDSFKYLSLKQAHIAIVLLNRLSNCEPNILRLSSIDVKPYEMLVLHIGEVI